MSKSIMVIDYEEAQELFYESIEDFLQEIQELDSADLWAESIDKDLVRIYKIKDGQFKRVFLKHKTQVTFTVVETL